MRQRTSLARRLMTVQVLVIGLGIATLIVTAGLLTPRLFSQHLYEAGETDRAVQSHAMQALSSSLASGVLLAVVVSVSAAVVASWLLARRVAQPLERLAEAAEGVEIGALKFVDETRFTSEMSQLFDSLEDMSERLERASANRNQLMSDLSHELRTPLATRFFALKRGGVVSFGSWPRHAGGSDTHERGGHELWKIVRRCCLPCPVTGSSMSRSALTGVGRCSRRSSIRRGAARRAGWCPLGSRTVR